MQTRCDDRLQGDIEANSYCYQQKKKCYADNIVDSAAGDGDAYHGL